jgi:multiple sugar transport system substrate-binding protein
MYTRRAFGALGALAGISALGACSSSSTTAGSTSSAAPSGAASSAAAGGGSGSPVTLQFWTWATDIADVVAIWNKANPDIQVKVNSQSQGDALYTKLLTANKAGNPPDIAQVEYQALPSMITAGVPADISSAASTLKSHFDPSIYNLVSFGGALYGIPQDTAPMMLFYRKDLFAKYGLTVPTTWADYATTATQLRAKDPTKYLTTFSSGDPGWFSGLAAQAGGKWWKTSGTTWTVGIDDSPSKKVAAYWQGLVESGAIQGQPMYTPQWNKDLNDGTLISWPTAVWGAGVLEGIAPTTQGKWATAPLPTWTAGTRPRR